MAYESYASILDMMNNTGVNSNKLISDIPTLDLTQSAPASTGILDSLMNWGKGGGNAFGGFLGKTENGITTQGWGMPVISGLSGLMNGFMGMKNYGLAKDQFNFAKDSWQKNFDAQTKTLNSQMEDRQRARVASNPGAYQSVAQYMKENGV